MRNGVRAIGAATVLTAVMAANAWAIPTFTNDQVCGCSNFYTCATLTTSSRSTNA